MKMMKKNIKKINKSILNNSLDLNFDLDNMTLLNNNYESNRSFDFTLFYEKYSEIYPDKKRPDSLFLE
jgi:hypothetical protein